MMQFQIAIMEYGLPIDIWAQRDIMCGLMEVGIVLLMATMVKMLLIGTVWVKVTIIPMTIPPDAHVPNITTTPLANYLTVIAVLVPTVPTTGVKQIFPI